MDNRHGKYLQVFEDIKNGVFGHDVIERAKSYKDTEGKYMPFYKETCLLTRRDGYFIKVPVEYIVKLEYNDRPKNHQ